MSDNKPENPPAFPSEGLIVGTNEDGQTRNFPCLNPGMTLRDWFAGCSLSREHFSKDRQSRAKEAFEDADAMLVERMRR